MDPGTGRIAMVGRLSDEELLRKVSKLGIDEFVETEEELRARGYTMPIPPEALPRIAGMNRKARRAWARKQRKAGSGG